MNLTRIQVCPAHGGDRLDYCPPLDLNGIHDPPMVVCDGCMDDHWVPCKECQPVAIEAGQDRRNDP